MGDEVNLEDLASALMVIERIRVEHGLGVLRLEEKSGVSATAYFAWKAGVRSPSVSCFVAVVGTFGFETVIVRPNGERVPFITAQRVAKLVYAECKVRRISPDDLTARSGVSSATMYALRKGRDSRLQTIVSLAQAVDFTLLLQPGPA